MAHPTNHVSVDQVSGKTFDVVVIGGGTTGLALAARLASLNTKLSIVLLEAGGPDANEERAIVPLLSPQAIQIPDFTWPFGLAPQKGLYNREVAYPRGKVLGGTSQVNWMFAMRGPSDDWDRIAKFTGDDSWNWKNMLPYAKRSETFVPPTSGIDISKSYDTSANGTDGPLKVSITNDPQTGSRKVIEAATKGQISEGKLNTNINSGKMLGVGWLPGSIGGGLRSSSLAYLKIATPNLHILTKAAVAKILFDESGSKATGVRFIVDGTHYEVNASKEVVLSAGAIGSPHILMLSGVGDAKKLQEFSIPVVKDAPDVGQNMQDRHLIFPCHWLTNSKDSFDTMLQDADAAKAAQEQFGTKFTGPLSNMVAQSIGFFRVPEGNKEFQSLPDPSSGPGAPHYEVLFGDGYMSLDPPPASGNFFSAVSVNLSPSSRGFVTIASTDPLANPYIDPNLMGTEWDVQVAIEAIKKSREIAKAPVFEGFLREEHGPDALCQTDKELEDLVRRKAISCWHTSCTVMLANKEGTKGLLNSDLSFKGIPNLRVADSSIFPYIPTTHPQMPLYMVAEKTADLIATKYA